MKAILTAILAFGVVLAPAEAQQATKVARVGFLAPQGRSPPLFEAFQKGLAELGYVEGRNVVIEPRFAEGHYERFPEIFAELAGLKVDVLAVTGAVTAGGQESGHGHPSSLRSRSRSGSRQRGIELGAARRKPHRCDEL